MDDHAIVRLLRAATSETDLEIARGLDGFAGVMGQQFVGQVETARGKHSNLLGKRVVGSAISACGACDMCQAGLGPHCRNRKVMGARDADGCFAELFSVPVKSLVLVPEGVDNDHAIFAQDVASAIQVCNRLTIQGRPFVTVLGDGAAALIKAQVMSKLNASVRVIGSHGDRLAVCEKWGIKHRSIEDVGLRADQDIVVECTGTSEGLRTALRLIRPRGKVVLTTVHAQKIEFELNSAIVNELEVLGAYAGPVPEAVAMLSRRELEVLSLISKRMKLDDGPAILRAAAQPGALKVMVDP